MKKRKGSSLGCLFWLAILLLVLVVFVSNKDNVNKALARLGIIPSLETEETVSQPATPDVNEEIIETDAVPQSPPEVVEITISTPEDESEDESTPASPEKPAIEEEEPFKEDDKPQEVATQYRNTRRANLFFIKMKDDGTIDLWSIIRPIQYDNAPLSQTIRVLIKGLTTEELQDGLLSAIPIGTELLSARVENGIAYLNFNDEIRYSRFGMEGLNALRNQIVYTATEFPTINAVQFMIEGSIREYMGTEGVYIGSPLSRAALN